MIMTYAKYSFLAIITLLVMTVSATSFKELKVLQDLAVKNRKSIDQYRITSAKAQYEHNMAKSRLLYPNLDSTYRFQHLSGHTPSEDQAYHNLGLKLSYNLFRGFYDKYQIRHASSMVQASNYNRIAAQSELKYQVALAYIEIYQVRNSLDVANESVSMLEKHLEDIEKRYAVGLVYKNEVLKVKVELGEAQQEVTSNLNALEMNYVTMKRMLLSDKAREMHLAFDALATKPLSKEYEIYETEMMVNRSELKYMDYLADAAAVQVQIAEADYYPTVDSSVSWSWNDNEPAVQAIGESTDLRAQIDVSFNLFDGYRKRMNVKKMSLENQVVENDRIELIAEMKQELSRNVLAFDTAKKVAEISALNHQQAKENYRITLLQFEKGLLTNTDVLDARLMLTRAAYSEVNAQAGLHQAYQGIIRSIQKY